MPELARSQRLQGEGSGDFRTSFQRDRDRILYSAHFRRLSGVTQVTSPTELHTFHNRLTHTLEVAQISRRIAERLLTTNQDLKGYLDPDVCETAALIHDLGHPPFGHNGEKTLDSLARDASADHDGYEGNAQSLRIITKLAVRAAGVPGLNLTVASLRASTKYPWLRESSGKRYEKFGVYRTEEVEFRLIFDGLEQEQTLEAQVMDWADDVAYSVHDLYDFVLAGVIPLHQLQSQSVDSFRAMLPNLRRGLPDQAFSTVITSLKFLPTPNLDTASRFSSDLVANLKTWVSAQITRFTTQKLSIRQDNGNCMLDKQETIEDEVTVLKALTYHYAIGSPALAVRQTGEKAILSGLFQILLDDAKGDKRLMSAEAQSRLNQEQDPIRIVLDTISSMTDAQAASTYQKLTGHALASVLDAATPSVL